MGIEKDGDFLKEGTRLLTQLAVELGAEQPIGAGRHGRSENRTTHRNRHWERTWETRVGEIPLRTLKLRKGTSSASLLEAMKQLERPSSQLISEQAFRIWKTRIEQVLTDPTWQ